jgi:hypothetical protein
MHHLHTQFEEQQTSGLLGMEMELMCIPGNTDSQSAVHDASRRSP